MKWTFYKELIVTAVFITAMWFGFWIGVTIEGRGFLSLSTLVGIGVGFFFAYTQLETQRQV